MDRITALTFCRLWLLLVACGSACTGSGPTKDTRLGDGTVQRESMPACGDAAVAARLAGCRSTTDETACRSAGGNWQAIGLTRAPTYTCVCPTGQAGCRCSSAADCKEDCQASPKGGASGLTCDGVTDYTCVGFAPWTGCFCTIASGGSIQIKCRD